MKHIKENCSKACDEQEQKNGRRSIKVILASSAHSIVICIILLCSVSWAWFSQTIDAHDVRGQTAKYGISATVSGNGAVTDGDYKSYLPDGERFIIEVESGKVHDITLTGRGTATWKGGYCVVSAGDNIRYTERILPDEKLAFQIYFVGMENGSIEFLPYWGDYPKDILGDANEETGERPIKEDYAVITSGKYIVSGGDFVVSPGDVQDRRVTVINVR